MLPTFTRVTFLAKVGLANNLQKLSTLKVPNSKQYFNDTKGKKQYLVLQNILKLRVGNTDVLQFVSKNGS